MVVHKKRKSVRQRGLCSHGWGAKKKHRGAGHRGGRGMAGTGKRGDAKKPLIWDTDYFGKHGFTSHSGIGKIEKINVWEVDNLADKLVERKLAQKQGGMYVVDLNGLGCSKLLSAGKVTKKLRITADYASSRAVEKVRAAGGDVIIRGGAEDHQAEADDASEDES